MKTWFMNLSMARKQVFTLLFVGLLPMFLVSFLASVVAERELHQQANNQLQAVRQIKAQEIERYFEKNKRILLSMAESPTLVNASGAFTRSFKRVVSAQDLSPERIAERRTALETFYTNEFARKFAEENDNKAIDIAGLMRALGPEAIALQYTYIANNPFPLGQKDQLNDVQGRSVYHRTHAKYHANFRSFAEKFDYYDLFIVDANSGDVVYSVFKELDYATSLTSGPYQNSGLAKAFKTTLNKPEGQVVITDYQSYVPSYLAPAGFISTPIFYNEELISVLIAQLPLEPVNEIMNERAGMGETGESYLVGEDLLMRSDAFHETRYHSVKSSFRHPEQGKVQTLATERALRGENGEDTITDFKGTQVLSSYARVELGDFSWIIVSEISSAEAFAGITSLNWTMIMLAVGFAAAILFFAIYISRLISYPILQLSEHIKRVDREGSFEISHSEVYADEVGETSRAFNSLIKNLGKALNGTNTVLQGLAKGEFDKEISNTYPGQLGTIVDGVNQAASQVKAANQAQERQKAIAETNAQQAATAAQEAKQQATRALIIKQALDVSATAVMIADAGFNVIYMNNAISKMMSEAEAQLRGEIPGFNAKRIMGANIDQFHKSPAHQRQLLKQLKGNHKTQLTIAELNFTITASPIRDESDGFLGSVIEWENITERLAQEREDKRIADENARIRQALDNSSTCTLIADPAFKIIYANNAIANLLRANEQNLRRTVADFSTSTLMGQTLGHLHPDLNAQRSLLQSRKETQRCEVRAGDSTFAVASTPILDRQGEHLGVVVEWADRTSEIAVENEIDQLISAAAAGDFSRELSVNGKQGFFLSVSHGLNRLLKTTNIALEDILRIFSALATGDLRQRIDRDYSGEFAKLKTDANATIDKLRSILEEISGASASIARSTSELSVGNADLSQRTEEQASSLEQTASSMEEMLNIVRQSEANAKEATQLATNSIAIARKGNDSVQATADAMREISKASGKIANIIGAIDEIAFQTNLLALNAAVEAARAGEQGRGFAVVAAEVRNLAQRSASAAKEIKSLIQDSVNKVQDGSELVEDSGETLKSIVTAIERVGGMMEQIFNSAREQTSGIEQVNTAVAQMDQMTQQNAALVEEASATSESMSEMAHQLDTMVAFFKR